MTIRTYISIIILNVNELNVPTKRHRLAEWIEKQQHQQQQTHIYAVYRERNGNPLHYSCLENPRDGGT